MERVWDAARFNGASELAHLISFPDLYNRVINIFTLRKFSGCLCCCGAGSNLVDLSSSDETNIRNLPDKMTVAIMTGQGNRKFEDDLFRLELARVCISWILDHGASWRTVRNCNILIQRKNSTLFSLDTGIGTLFDADSVEIPCDNHTERAFIWVLVKLHAKYCWSKEYFGSRRNWTYKRFFTLGWLWHSQAATELGHR